MANDNARRALIRETLNPSNLKLYKLKNNEPKSNRTKTFYSKLGISRSNRYMPFDRRHRNKKNFNNRSNNNDNTEDWTLDSKYYTNNNDYNDDDNDVDDYYNDNDDDDNEEEDGYDNDRDDNSYFYNNDKHHKNRKVNGYDKHNSKNDCNDDYNNDANNDDDCEDTFKIDICRGKKQNKNKIKDIILPGGMAKVDIDACSAIKFGEAPAQAVKQIRTYMDILFSSIAIEAHMVALMQERESMLALPGVISAILEYNNVSFRTIKYCITKRQLFEPVWFYINTKLSELTLFFNTDMYNKFCMKDTKSPITFTSGIIPVELLNPYDCDPNYDGIDLGMLHCAIMADHTAQHILSALFDKNKIPCADIHDNFTKYGTTLHSMFYIEQFRSPMPQQEHNNFMTFFDYPSITTSGGSNRMLGQTQSLINKFINPSNLTSSENVFEQQQQLYDTNTTNPTFRYGY